jgi:hypothetical protein
MIADERYLPAEQSQTRRPDLAIFISATDENNHFTGFARYIRHTRERVASEQYPLLPPSGKRLLLTPKTVLQHVEADRAKGEKELAQPCSIN